MSGHVCDESCAHTVALPVVARPRLERADDPPAVAAAGRTGPGAYPSDPERATDDLSGPDEFHQTRVHLAETNVVKAAALREYADRHHRRAPTTLLAGGVCERCHGYWPVDSDEGCDERRLLLADAAAIEAGLIEPAGPEARSISGERAASAHMPELSIRDRVVDAIAAAWRRRAAERVEASPEDHARAFADVAIDTLARADALAREDETVEWGWSARSARDGQWVVCRDEEHARWVHQDSPGSRVWIRRVGPWLAVE